MNDVREKTTGLVDIMHFFINGDWHYENKKINRVIEKMTPEEFEIFYCDASKFGWDEYLKNYVKGLSIWALKEDQIEPIHGLDQIVRKNYNRFDNLKFSMAPRLNFREKTT